MAPVKHVWIELIGFDCSAPDFGVAGVLEDMGDRPELLSLLLFSAEFVHAHRDDDDGLIPSECTSYAARPSSLRGPRQEWTRAQLRGLIRTLQSAGIRVVFAVFDLHQFQLDGETRLSAWNVEHPELTVIDRTGARREGLLNPLGRLADGRQYVETFVVGLAAVFEYYGFDGLHGADGFSSPRLPLWAADYSDDMIDQFEAKQTIVVPAGTTPERAEWIWSEARLEWIEFSAQRWTEFWGAVADCVHAFGGEVMLNNAWMRDPFEALYRFGVDYRRLAAAGVDRFVLETVAAGVELLEETTHPPIHAQMAAVMLVSAHLPGVPLTGLVSVHDSFEQWDVVHTAPAMLERDQRILTAMRSSAPGSPVSSGCLDASLYCLADGISADVWADLDRLRRTCGASATAGPAGYTLLYSPDTLDAEIAGFRSDRVASTHSLLSALFRTGAVIGSIAPIADHRVVAGPVLVLRPDLYPGEVIDAILKTHDEVLTLGPQTSASALGFTGRWSVRQRTGGASGVVERTEDQLDFRPVDELGEVIETWLVDLPMQLPPAHLLDEVAAILRPGVGDGGPLGTSGASRAVQVVVPAGSASTIEVILHNTGYRFRDAQFTADHPIVSARSASGDITFPVRFDGYTLTTRVPPKGVVSLLLQTEDTP